MVIHSRICSATLRIATLSCLAVLASTGTATASCPSQSVSTPFSQWGDTNNYFVAPGGDFEAPGAPAGWSLSNATLTSGNEPFYVGNSTDSQSLTINAGGSATSPYFCVDNTISDLRFFAQEVAAGSDLQVTLLVQRRCRVMTVPLTDLADGSMPSWAPTNPIDLGTLSIPGNTSIMAAVQFVAPLSAGSWQIDDVYVDPYRSG